MKREERLEGIIQSLSDSNGVIAGAVLAQRFKVSRQIIVQDIGLLKAANYHIISTNKGYLLIEPPGKQKVVKVCHSNEEIQDELYTIIDAGGKVKDVFVKHEVYGEIRVVLSLETRQDVDALVSNLLEGKMSPLMRLTGKYHFHTIEATSDQILFEVEKKLKEKKYLVD
jgi:transcriptional regulator of NAD metabolism